MIKCFNDPHEVCLPILTVHRFTPSHQRPPYPTNHVFMLPALPYSGCLANRDVLEGQTAVRVLTDDSQTKQATRNKHLHRFYNKSSTQSTDERIPGRQQ